MIKESIINQTETYNTYCGILENLESLKVEGKNIKRLPPIMIDKILETATENIKPHHIKVPILNFDGLRKEIKLIKDYLYELEQINFT